MSFFKRKTNKKKEQVDDYPRQAPLSAPAQPPAYGQPTAAPPVVGMSSMYAGSGMYTEFETELSNDCRNLYNQVRDPNVPPPPGAVTMTAMYYPAPPGPGQTYFPMNSPYDQSSLPGSSYSTIPPQSQPPPPAYPGLPQTEEKKIPL